MHSLERSQTFTTLRCISGGLLSLILLSAPTVVLAHGGHGDEFQGGGEPTGSVEVDAETAKRLEIKVEAVKRQQLAVGIKSTGQIETLPSQKAEVNTPIQEAKVVELLVEPGAVVKKGQPVAVVTSPALVTLRVESQEKLAQGQADLQQAQADLRLAQQNYERYQQIAKAEIASAQSRVAFAQEKYLRDKQLADAGALPLRNALESQTQLAEAQAELAKASSRRDVIAAENQLKRAYAGVAVAKSRIQLSNATYQTRLQQLGTRANTKGLVTVTAPIDGLVADRDVTLGQSFNDAGGKLMTIVDDSQVFATANIYEKDLDKVKAGQRVSVKIPSMPERTFTGRITVIGSVVAGETRVVPVKAQIDNPGGVLKPGMFAEVEVLTDQKSTARLAIPKTAVVEANGKTNVYVQNGNAFKSVEVTLGQTSGALVEVSKGLFEGDIIVTQRATQLYAQSLRGDSKPKQGEEEEEGTHKEEGQSHSEETKAEAHNYPLPLWLIGALGGTAIATGAFVTGSSWSSRRTPSHMVAVGDTEYDSIPYDTEIHIDNHKQPTLSTSKRQDEERENPHQRH